MNKQTQKIITVLLILFLLCVVFRKNTIERHCSVENEDPWASGHNVDCCGGLNPYLNDWNNTGRKYYKCLHCTEEGNDPYGRSNILGIKHHIPCCDGSTKQLIGNKYKCVKSNGPGPDPSTGTYSAYGGNNPIQKDHLGVHSYANNHQIPYMCMIVNDGNKAPYADKSFKSKIENMDAIKKYYGSSNECMILFDDNYANVETVTKPWTSWVTKPPLYRSSYKATQINPPSNKNPYRIHSNNINDATNMINQCKGKNPVCVFDLDGTLLEDCTHNNNYSEAVKQCHNMGAHIALNTAESVGGCKGNQDTIFKCINNSVR